MSRDTWQNDIITIIKAVVAEQFNGSSIYDVTFLEESHIWKLSKLVCIPISYNANKRMRWIRTRF